MEINLILKQKRKELKLTQEQVAQKIFVSQKSVSNWETGKTFPDIYSLIRLAQLYDLSLDNLLLEESDIVEDIDKKIKVASIFNNVWFFIIGGTLGYVLLVHTLFNEPLSILHVIRGVIIFSAYYLFNNYSKSKKYKYLFDSLFIIGLSALLTILWSLIRWAVVSGL
ncbi:putative transcriptional regulator (Xre family); skin element [Carnobacterium sp. 17-4]|uniref:helix-turn-helix domain-containing protein n=1 Tax=Carnobacterium sp. (strain 17-4) TaxID=208596 RepID=UPI00020584F9|nr:helix-turn-helix transcriptional regulator [Carnobacterium sp. 17-4]AEB29890.1 putative transcriptional regulator (Xre family); skin element [Carnobacterium sp. 17-4]